VFWPTHAVARMVGTHWPGCFGSRYLVALPDTRIVNDAERLRHNPAMRWIVGGKAARSSAASPSQMGRLETQWFAVPKKLRCSCRPVWPARGTCERWIKEGKGAIKWTRLSCERSPPTRCGSHALVYNLSNFLHTLATPEPIKHWSLTTLKDNLIKIGAKVMSHGRTSSPKWPRSPSHGKCCKRFCGSSESCGRSHHQR
jgi:hypothetical protein